MDEITLTIDQRKVKASSSMTVLEAAMKAGIYIPTLCYHPSLTPYGACRLCIVEIEGLRGFPTSCTTPASEGMIVKTNTPQIQELRRDILELAISEHPYSCLTCHEHGQCEFQNVAAYVGTGGIKLSAPEGDACADYSSIVASFIGVGGR